MSPLQWIIAVIVFIPPVAACIFVNRMQKQGQRVPGRMCAGCPNACAIREKPPACIPAAPDHPSET